MGKQTKNKSSNTARYRLMWNEVKYEPGEIKVIAYDENGKVAMEEVVRTAGKPHHIVLTTDRKELTADGQDLAYVTATIVDAKGNVCVNATDQLNFKVTGAGAFKVVANGDATSLELFHLPTMKAFSGSLVVTVQAAEQAGILTLQVSGKGLKTASLPIVIK